MGEPTNEELARGQRRARERVEERLRALEEIDRRREEILARRGGKPIGIDPAALIDESREERDDRLISQLAPDRDGRERPRYRPGRDL